MNESHLLDSYGAAQYLGTTPRTLRRWTERGLDIPLIRVSSSVLSFDPVDLRAWTDARKQLAKNSPLARQRPPGLHVADTVPGGVQREPAGHRLRSRGRRRQSNRGAVARA